MFTRFLCDIPDLLNVGFSLRNFLVRVALLNILPYNIVKISARHRNLIIDRGELVPVDSGVLIACTKALIIVSLAL